MRAGSLDHSAQMINKSESEAQCPKTTNCHPFTSFIENVQSEPLDLSCNKGEPTSGPRSHMGRASDNFKAKMKTAHNAGFTRRPRDNANRKDYIDYLAARKRLDRTQEHTCKAWISQEASLRYPLQSSAGIDLTGYCYEVIDEIQQGRLKIARNSPLHAEVQCIRAIALVTINLLNRKVAPLWR